MRRERADEMEKGLTATRKSCMSGPPHTRHACSVQGLTRPLYEVGIFEGEYIIAEDDTKRLSTRKLIQ